MLDGILGRGFSSKCKSFIKPTRTRIDLLRSRQEATQRFLKGNLAQLLANGLDINAYGRELKQTEEFLAGLNLLSCYDFIEQSCEYILQQLSIMQKQRECPEECREAVGSLMFAAARFSDLPELRDLRDTFQERYGSSLEHFVNKEFVEKLALRPPTIEKKIQLLQGIALEFSIKWDSRGFEQRMANPSAFAEDQPKKHRPAQDHDNKYKLPNGKESVIKTQKGNHSFKARSELSDKHSMQNGKEDNLLKRDDLDHHVFGREGLTGYKYQAKGERNHKPLMGEQTTPKQDNHGIPFSGRGEFINDKCELSPVNGKEDALRRVRTGSSSRAKRPEFVDCGYELHNDKVNHVPKTDGQGPVYDGKPEVVARVAEVSGRRGGKDASPASYNDYGQPNTANSPSKIQEQETDRLKPYSSNGLPPPYIKSKDKLVPPPYIKSKDSKYGISAEAKHPSSDSDEVSIDPSVHKKGNAVHRSKRIQGESDRTKYENPVLGPARSLQDDLPLPKPRSIRRKHSKSSTSHEDLGNYEDASVAKKSSSSRRRDYSRRGMQVLFDDEHYQKDDEERMIDKLLMHYSKKPSTFEPERLRRKSKAYALGQQAADAGESPHYGRDGPDVRAEMVHPTRSISLPHEQTASADAVKVYARANSFQPDKPAGHVHPKLPDYDDLAAHFAALKGQ